MNIRRCVACLLMAVTCGSSHAKIMDFTALEQIFNEPITTSVTGSPQRSSQVPATLEIITAEDIRRSGAYDIPSILRHVLGVDVFRWTNDSTDISVRGYNQAYSSRLLVLIDGRQVYADYFSLTPWGALPIELSEIRQIEVVKGPNSALFGFNAVGGVVNIITYNALDNSVNTAALTGGTQRLQKGSVTMTKKISDKIGLRIAAGGRKNDDFSTQLPPSSFGVRRGEHQGEINAVLDVRFNEKLEGNLEATYSKNNQTEYLPSYVLAYTHYETHSEKASLTADTNIGILKATVYNNWINVDIYQGPSRVSLAETSNQVTVAELQDIFKIGNSHVFRLSTEYRYNEMPTLNLHANVYYDVISAGAMWDWKIIPSLSLTNALRIDRLSLGRYGQQPAGSPFTNNDWNRRYLVENSYNSGVVWQANEMNTFRLTAARGVEVPNLTDFGGGILFLPTVPVFFDAGVPTMNPTSVISYELGWDRTLSMISAETRVSAFHEITDSIISISGGNLLPSSLLVTPINSGNSQATGLEMSIKSKNSPMNNWRWGVGYTPEIVRDHFSHGLTLNTIVTDFQHTLPVHVVKANLGWSHGSWEIDGFLHYQSHANSIQGGLTPGAPTILLPINSYISIDGRIGYALNKYTTLSLSGQNITHTSQQQTSAPMVERRVFGTITVSL